MNLEEIRGFCSERGIPYLLTPEYAYLTDLKHHRADSEWKAVRKAKAKSALKTLALLAVHNRPE